MTAEQRDPKILYELILKAAGNLRYENDINALLEVALPERAELLYDIAFRAKFVVGTRKIMERLPPRDDAREQLKNTFQEEIEILKKDILVLADSFPETVHARFYETFFSPTIESFGALMDLLHDLSWIQNIRIDKENM